MTWHQSFSRPTQPSIPQGSVNGKWVSASAGKAKAGTVHSVSGWTRVCRQNWDPLKTRAILERLRGEFAMQIHVYLTLPYLLRLRFNYKYHDAPAYKFSVTSASFFLDSATRFPLKNGHFGGWWAIYQYVWPYFQCACAKTAIFELSVKIRT